MAEFDLRERIAASVEKVMAKGLSDVATQGLLDQEAAKFTQACAMAGLDTKPWKFSLSHEDGQRTVTVGFRDLSADSPG